MSVWAEVVGRIAIHRDRHFSLRKSAKEVFGDEMSLKVDNEEAHFRNIAMTFCADGENAAVLINEWVKKIPGSVDINANIRWIK